MFKLMIINLFIGLALLSQSMAFAAVAKVNIDQMLAVSALVIQGSVIGKRVEQGDGRNIHTIITLEISDTVKGSWHQPTIDISFLGGSINGLALSVGGQHIPELGQEGVFFIENPLQNQVNPLFGWEQGLFVVETDANSGEKVITTTSKQHITGIEFLPADSSQTRGLSDGVATGIILQHASELKALYTLTKFKADLRARLAEGE